MSDPQPPRTPPPVERLGTTTRHRSYLDSLPPIRSGKQMYGVNGEIQPYSVILRVLKTMDCYEITSTEDPIESPAKKQKIVDEISTPFPNLTDITIVTFNGKNYNIYGYSYYEYIYLSEKSKQKFLELVDLSETKLNIYTTKLKLILLNNNSLLT